MAFDRRKLLKLAAMGLATAAAPSMPAGAASKARTRIVFLGTKGGPRVGGNRSNPANLLMVGDTPYVIDCGYGVTRQLTRAGLSLPRLKYIFISHHHSDHNLEYGNLIYSAWAAGLKTPIQSFGPKGLVHMTEAFWELNRFDIETRIADEGRPDLRKLVTAKDIDSNGVVLQNDDVKVTCFRTPHPPITDNFAYKFETPDGTVVFSSDTDYNPKLAEFAKNADVLVHEAMYLPGVDRLVARVRNGARLKEHLLASHTITDDVGRIAAAAGVKTLVLSHLVPGDDASITDAMWTEGVRKHFTGNVVVAKDLMELPLPV